VSGFFGMLRSDGAPIEERLLQEIAAELRFLAPYGVNVWSAGNIGGCFALMRTGPAAQTERQPCQADDRFYLWGDVRLDGREELHGQIGNDFCGLGAEASSEEYFLRAWQKWGESALERVIGDFSLALWDAQKKKLWCARDFIGPRPFYYAQAGPLFCFSNTLNTVRRVPGVSEELDEGFLGDFLLDGWNQEPSRTVYRDIRRLPAGHVLQWGNGHISIRRFRKLPVEEPLRLKRPEEYVERYLAVVRAAVKDHLPEGPTAFFLSGGMDSGAVSAIAADLARQNGRQHTLKAYTVSWEALLNDPEPAMASLTAHHLGLAHEIIPRVNVFPVVGSVELTPEPLLEPFSSQEDSPYPKVAGHANVALTGHGGDDILTGQAWPYLVHLWNRREWKALAGDFGGYLWTHGRVPPLRGGFRARITDIFKFEDAFEQYPQWLDPEFESRANLRERWLERRNKTDAIEHPLHSKAYNFLHGGFWAGFLETEDAEWTGVNLEMRAPLLDLRVLQYLLRLPPVPWCANKRLTRVAMKGLLPPEIINRPKTPMAEGELEKLDPRCIRARDIDTASDASEKLKRFVNFAKWCETFSGPKGSLNWMNLRPLSLLKWLKAIENAKGIK
jgi:asparagine synthase (glutamine-hydrolysing)